MQILLVEDEEAIASFVLKGLRAEGHTVSWAPSAKEATQYAECCEFDVVILDLILLDGHGLDVLKALRDGRIDVPVIVVSALGEVDDKVALLDAGADDYLVKPFDLAELSARIRANTRQAGPSTRQLTAADVTLDTRTRRATRKGVTVELPNREFALLEYFLSHPGQVLSRQQLLDAVWGIQFDPGTNVVDVYVGYLRRKLDRPGEPSFIETVRGVGYRVAE